MLEAYKERGAAGEKIYTCLFSEEGCTKKKFVPTTELKQLTVLVVLHEKISKGTTIGTSASTWPPVMASTPWLRLWLGESVW